MARCGGRTLDNTQEGKGKTTLISSTMNKSKARRLTGGYIGSYHPHGQYDD